MRKMQTGHLAYRPQSKKQRLKEVITEELFADLRAQYPLYTLEKLQVFKHNFEKAPACNQHVEMFKFDPASVGCCTNNELVRRWVWWRELTKFGIFVDELVQHTPMAYKQNAETHIAGVGHVVIKSSEWTLCWYPSSLKVYCPNGGPDMAKRLSLMLPPWHAVQDQASFHEMRNPVHSPGTSSQMPTTVYSQRVFR